MKYIRIYWMLFAPKIRKSISARFSKELGEQAVRQGKKEYRRLLSRCNDFGPGNPMASNAYFAYVFAAAWLGTEKKITPDQMAFVMTDVLESQPLKTVFGVADSTSYRWLKEYRNTYQKENE